MGKDWGFDSVLNEIRALGVGNLVFDLIKSPHNCFPDTRDRREFDHLTFPPFGALLGQNPNHSPPTAKQHNPTAQISKNLP